MNVKRLPPMLLALAMSSAQAMAMQMPDAGAIQLSREVGACLAEKRPEIADVFLRTKSTSDARKVLDMVAVDRIVASCLGGQGEQVDLAILRGGVAEASYRREFPTMPDAALIATVEPVIPEAEDKAIKLRYWFAQCLVNASAEGADAFVRSAPGSPQEGGGVAAIAPVFSGCLPKDMTAKFTRPELRALVSEALYRAATTLRDEQQCRQMSFEDAVRDRRNCPAIAIPDTNMIRMKDYPDASLSAREAGKVTVQFSVGTDGNVTPGTCVVTLSSGHDRLDKNTCAIVSTRFRFRPALLRGKPVPQVRNTSTRYLLPQGF